MAFPTDKRPVFTISKFIGGSKGGKGLGTPRVQFLSLPPAYVVRREGNVLTRVCPSVCPQGGYPYPIMLCNITQNAMGQPGGTLVGGYPGRGVPGRGYPGGGLPGRGCTLVGGYPAGGTLVGGYPAEGYPVRTT